MEKWNDRKKKFELKVFFIFLAEKNLQNRNIIKEIRFKENDK